MIIRLYKNAFGYTQLWRIKNKNDNKKIKKMYQGQIIIIRDYFKKMYIFRKDKNRIKTKRTKHSSQTNCTNQHFI